ncbi:hypothetical protein [Armatimonas sp.]|uniref:hypothetical protein n=1 Tax=Armatimonas sp. TaxID=1872638 RepID=UPI003752B68D
MPATMIAEADLLKRIEAAVPLAALQRRKALKATQAQRELTPEEHNEFAASTSPFAPVSVLRSGRGTLANIAITAKANL